MLEFLVDHFEFYAGHEEGAIFAGEFLCVAIYNGDGYWQLYKKGELASFETALATGCGLSSLKCALGLNGWSSAKTDSRPTRV